MDSILKLSDSTSSEIIEILKSKTKSQLKDIRAELDHAYYNTDTPLISDDKYDIFYDYLISRIPQERRSVGARLRDHISKTNLPYWMGSLDKKKDQKSVDRWCKSFGGNYFISEKLDGISLLVEFDGSENVKLYTRGDGQIGSDVSHLSRYIKLLSKPYQSYKGFVRGELIVTTTKFQKYKDIYDNPRQMVAGIVNAKTLKKGVEDIDFVAYQIMTSLECISKQYRVLTDLGFKTPRTMGLDSLDVDRLTQILYDMKKSGIYSLDGIVITDDNPHPVNTSGNPDYAWAFKIVGNIYSTVVEDVEWNISKVGVLKPTIKINPVKMEDVTVSYVTGFNAKYIKDNGIGRGAVLKIIRSGDVIPHIVDISKKSIPSFPSTEYRWNSSGIDIIAILDEDQKSRDEFNIRYLTEFCSKLKILNLGESTISKLYHNGWDTLYKILDSNPESFSCIKGLGQKSSQRIYQSIQNAIPNVTLAQFIGASNVLGQGIAEKKVNMILEAYPNIFTDTTITDVTKIIGDLRGFSKITVSKIAANIDKTRQLVREYDKFFNFYRGGDSSAKGGGELTKAESKAQPNNEGTSTDTRNSRGGFIKVVFTGFRDKELESRIRQVGGVVSGSVTKSVNYVIVKDLENRGGSSKIEKAEDYGIKIVDRQFIVEFLNSLG